MVCIHIMNKVQTKSNFRTKSTSQAEEAFTLIATLKQCARKRDLTHGKLLHSEAVQAGYHTNLYVASALINMYSKCGAMDLAQDVFDHCRQPDVVAWNSLILGYVHNGRALLAMDIFSAMNSQPDAFTLAAACKACSLMVSDLPDKVFCLEKGISLHMEARRRGLDTELVIGSSLVEMYSNSGSMLHADKVFNRTVSRDVVLWNILILGYVGKGESLKALELLLCMDSEPDRVTFVAGLKAVARMASGEKQELRWKRFCAEKGVALQKRAWELGLEEDIFVASNLVDMYGKSGEMFKAWLVFERAVFQDCVLWTNLILAYVENGDSLTAMELFVCMDCEPDALTFVAALKACIGLADEKMFCLEKAIAVHWKARECGADRDQLVANTLVDVYSKCKSMNHARAVFESMIHRTVVSWNGLALGYVENGNGPAAVDVLSNMECESEYVTFVVAVKAFSGLALEKRFSPEFCLSKAVALHKKVRHLGLDGDMFLGNSLVFMYGKCRSMAHARAVFDTMSERDTVTWTSLMLGYIENGDCIEAIELFLGMDCEPNPITYVAALKACGTAAELEVGQRVHRHICKLGLEQVQIVANSLVDFYGKCGRMSSAEHVFNGMRIHNKVSWNTLIARYSSHTDMGRVFGLVEEMELAGVDPDGITLIFILVACSRLGLVREGKRYFESVKVGLTVEHYACMVDMLGRTNRFDEAVALIRTMPAHAQKNGTYSVWQALLGACKDWDNVEVAKAAFDALTSAEHRLSLDGISDGNI